MKTRKLSLLFLLFIMHAQPQKTAQAPVSTPTATTNTASADPAQDLLKKNQAQAAALVFPADMPTKSINEKNIDQIYGSAGIKITDNDLINIKKCYCYLEFLVKINKVKTDKAWAQYASDFKDFLQPTADNSPLKPTLTLVNSKGWQAIQITAQDITESPAWQFFSKAMICDTLYNDALFVVDVAQTNNQLFPYIPNIEASYSDNNFTKLRLYEESIQLQALMQSEQRNRYLAQCIDWKGISPDKISGVVDQFKKTDFYNYTHNSQAAQPTKNPTTGLTNPVIIPSPTREQIVCYFMLIHIQTTVHDIITQVNAQSILAQTSSSVLAPNFLFYGPSDFIYFNDIFTLGNLTDQNNTSPKNPMLPMQTATATTSTTPTAASNSVKIQAIPSGISAAQTTPLAPAPAPASSDPNDVATSIFKQLPTTSISETTLDQVYGPSGLNIAIDQLTNSKKRCEICSISTNRF
jgi:hypothetical protein